MRVNVYLKCDVAHIHFIVYKFMCTNVVLTYLLKHPQNMYVLFY